MTYKSRVELSNISPISKDTMSLVYEAMWRVMSKNGMSANGYVHLKNGAKVFTSSNPTDVLLSLQNECWDTKKLFKDVKLGDKIYILPSRSLFESTKCQIGFEATASCDMYRLDEDSFPASWQLEREESIDGTITITGTSPVVF